MYYIYWIKRKEMNNPLNEGYIGYSKNPKTRFNDHKRVNTNSIVSNNLKKYDDIEIEILYAFENSCDALSKEHELRPRKYIGWNISCGGQCPPPISENVSARKKISNSIKRLGIVPYSTKTHSKETLAKSAATRLKNDSRAYHDPNSLESKFVKFGIGESIPDGWVAGRKPKKVRLRTEKLENWSANSMVWNVYKNGSLEEEVYNLKSWCRLRKLPYLLTMRGDRVLRETIRTDIKKSKNNTIIENGVETNISTKLYAERIGRHISVIYSAIIDGFYETKLYDSYKVERK
jgi:predicted GIY-YIG superfamily endonuclease